MPVTCHHQTLLEASASPCIDADVADAGSVIGVDSCCCWTVPGWNWPLVLTTVPSGQMSDSKCPLGYSTGSHGLSTWLERLCSMLL